MPAIPPGIDFQPTWDNRKPLPVIGTFSVIIELMYGLNTQEYAAPVDLSQLSYVSSKTDKVSIITIAVSQQLQPRHVILALYRNVRDMYSGQPGFFASDTTNTRNQVGIGRILIEDYTPASVDKPNFIFSRRKKDLRRICR